MITRGVTHLNTRTPEGQGRDFMGGWPAEGDGRGEEDGGGGGQGAREVEESLSPGCVLSRTD